MPAGAHARKKGKDEPGAHQSMNPACPSYIRPPCQRGQAVAAGHAKGEETHWRAAPEATSRKGEGALKGKNRGEEGAPEGRSLGGSAGHVGCSGSAGATGCSAAPVARDSCGMSLFHLACVMQQHYKRNNVLNTITSKQVAWW